MNDRMQLSASIDAPISAQTDRMAAFVRHADSVSLFGKPLRAWQEESRAAAGLSPMGAVVMTGHQAGIWHAGILAKWFVADLIRERCAAHVATLLVDQDVNDAASLAYPTLEGESLRSALLPADPFRRAGSTGIQPTVTLEPAQSPAVSEVADALERVRVAVNRERTAPNLALQMDAANAALLSEFMPSAPSVRATALLATPIGQALVDELVRNPAACARAYNEARAADPQVARPLGEGELPLWRVTPRGREPVRSDDLSGSLAPRALFMTAIARLALCDLFVHGTGGQRYERVTEVWMRRWLGVELAPIAVATATVRLPLEHYLGARSVTTGADLRRVEFDPDAEARGPSPSKMDLLARINAAPRSSIERRQRYQSLMRHIEARRAARADLIAHLRDEVRASKDLAASAEVARSRTWPWALHSAQSLNELRAQFGSL
jgi:hypothetical protein